MRFTPLTCLLPLVTSAALVAPALADDWGAYTIAPVSAKAMVLEVVGSGTTDGTVVSIGKPAATANQKWLITPKGDNFFTIHPLSSPALVLAAKGSAANGTPIVIETDNGSPEQWWTLNKNESGSFSLSPKVAPQMGIDDNGGKQDPGSKIDLWIHNPNDQHLQWTITPLAGSGLVAAAAPAGDLGPGGTPYVAPEIKPEEIKEGRIENFTFTESKIFPGTTRGVTVFIPAQYDGAKPACVYVKTDGYNPREKTLMETMIATKEMPVTVGVFVS
jgi:gluconolactonase